MFGFVHVFTFSGRSTAREAVCALKRSRGYSTDHKEKRQGDTKGSGKVGYINKIDK